MVALSGIRKSNAAYTAQNHEGLVCVFAGATAGIGAATLKKMVGMVRSSTFFVLGREPQRYQERLDELRRIAPTNEIVFVETEVSLVRGIDAACGVVSGRVGRVDVVCASMGGMPFQGAVYTKEGLETCFALSYHTRLRLISNLLPLLHRSPNPRVLSILNGTKETHIDDADPGLQSHWSIPAVVKHTTLLTSLAFDHLAATDLKAHLTLLHCTPGLVATGTPRTRFPSQADGLLWWAFVYVLQVLSGWYIRYCGMEIGESGERHAYELTSDAFDPGSWRVGKENDVVPDNEVLVGYREMGWAERVWEFTRGVWEGTLVKGGEGGER